MAFGLVDMSFCVDYCRVLFCLKGVSFSLFFLHRYLFLDLWLSTYEWYTRMNFHNGFLSEFEYLRCCLAWAELVLGGFAVSYGWPCVDWFAVAAVVVGYCIRWVCFDGTSAVYSRFRGPLAVELAARRVFAAISIWRDCAELPRWLCVRLHGRRVVRCSRDGQGKG